MILRISLLGTFEARSGTGPVLHFPTAKAKALLAYLALGQDQAHSRETLSDLLWHQAAAGRARANLRQALTRVRQTLPPGLPDCLIARNGTVHLDGQRVNTDARALQRLVAEGSLEDLEAAAALYRGDLLEGFSIDEPVFEDWLRDERRRLREIAIGCFEVLLDHYERTGAATRGMAIAARLLKLDPYRESVHRLLMRFYADQDRRGAALAQYRECRRLLAEELDVAPEAATTELFELIRANSPPTPFTRDPKRSRPLVSIGPARDRSSQRVVDLVVRSPWRGARSDKPSVAVLPFDCLDGEDGNRYLCDGIVEDVITNLSRFADLHVIARNSSFAYRGRALGLPKIGAELGARYLVEGSLQLRGDGIRLTAQLIDGQSGYHLWAERYDESAANLADLRDELTRRIAGHLVGRIEHQELAALTSRPPEQWEAYECWLRGIDLLRQVSPSRVEAATRCFERALEIDPAYGRAYAGLAMAQYKAWSCLDWTSWFKLQDTAFPYARKALELDDQDHHAHGIMGMVSLYTRDFGRARRHLERAERINPNDARLLANSAICWALMGAAERAVRMAELAVRLDPFHPDWYLAALGAAYYVARDYERAIAVLEMAPDGLCDTRAYLAAAHARSGNQAAARHHVQEFIRLNCERLGGDPARDVAHYVEALVRSNPYQSAADSGHFRDGLRRAGLPVPHERALGRR